MITTLLFCLILQAEYIHQESMRGCMILVMEVLVLKFAINFGRVFLTFAKSLFVFVFHSTSHESNL